jgi:acylphosphatase
VRKRVHVLVSGRVQGVFFRAECARRARDRGLSGFVSNRPDGRVEAAFEGEDADVRALVEWCREGPEWAHVEEIETREEPAAGHSDFRIT